MSQLDGLTVTAGSVEFTFFKPFGQALAGAVMQPNTADEAYQAGFGPAMLIEVKTGQLLYQWLQPFAGAISMLVRAHVALGKPERIGMWVVLTDIKEWHFFHVELGTWEDRGAIFLSKHLQLMGPLELSMREILLAAGGPAAAGPPAAAGHADVGECPGPSSPPLSVLNPATANLNPPGGVLNVCTFLHFLRMSLTYDICIHFVCSAGDEFEIRHGLVQPLGARALQLFKMCR